MVCVVGVMQLPINRDKGFTTDCCVLQLWCARLCGSKTELLFMEVKGCLWNTSDTSLYGKFHYYLQEQSLYESGNNLAFFCVLKGFLGTFLCCSSPFCRCDPRQWQGRGLREITDVLLAPLPGSCSPHGTKQRTNPEVSAEYHFGAKAAWVLWTCRSSHWARAGDDLPSRW